MIRISKKEASEQLQKLKESFGVEPIYIDENAAKAFECLELYINQTLLDRRPIPKELKDSIEATLNSSIDGLIYYYSKEMSKHYKKLKTNIGESDIIEQDRFLLSFFSFMQTHGIDEFINYVECSNFFKER